MFLTQCNLQEQVARLTYYNHYLLIELQNAKQDIKQLKKEKFNKGSNGRTKSNKTPA